MRALALRAQEPALDLQPVGGVPTHTLNGRNACCLRIVTQVEGFTDAIVAGAEGRDFRRALKAFTYEHAVARIPEATHCGIAAGGADVAAGPDFREAS